MSQTHVVQIFSYSKCMILLLFKRGPPFHRHCDCDYFVHKKYTRRNRRRQSGAAGCW